MPNISAATAKKRRLLGNVVHSLLLFGAPIWANHMSPTGMSKMASVQRKTALRVSSAYCTVSADAALVVASMPPIDVLAKERLFMHSNKNVPDARSKARDETIRLWQTRWDNSSKGRWTHRLIPSISLWLVGGMVTSTFTSRNSLPDTAASFPVYLHRFGKLDSPVCWFCEQADDDAYHTTFACDAWESRRSAVNAQCGTIVTPDNIIEIMLHNQQNWEIVSAFIHEVMKKKEAEERRRQSIQVLN